MKLSNEHKIETAKRFESLHKASFFNRSFGDLNINMDDMYLALYESIEKAINESELTCENESYRYKYIDICRTLSSTGKEEIFMLDNV